MSFGPAANTAVAHLLESHLPAPWLGPSALEQRQSVARSQRR
ncbi:hypothetical protein SAMN02745121_08303 [Nannocystis exedens]|uniref:Uncharacterized protein n=1 Tax=Nannocystis exedens TaxID=54 RepID=A0A1I2HX67_9BACT|nr:hypothetical protein [Nannocystis exedens]PCC66385.1 hypothetical protein NAEX_08973 [Nannocystis exedens]PCC75769.1 hypothetical protein NAEX_08882 [Nannocystis exedens]SFF34735.1 hypothetical protein SAMN02745121_08303 [Nannocystis exedens]